MCEKINKTKFGWGQTLGYSGAISYPFDTVIQQRLWAVVAHNNNASSIKKVQFTRFGVQQKTELHNKNIRWIIDRFDDIDWFRFPLPFYIQLSATKGFFLLLMCFWNPNVISPHSNIYRTECYKLLSVLVMGSGRVGVWEVRFLLIYERSKNVTGNSPSYF